MQPGMPLPWRASRGSRPTRDRPVPFVPADALDAGTLDRVRAVVAAVPSFDHAFGTCGWFGDALLRLAPDDPAPFPDLTRRVSAAFPRAVFPLG
jgi:hypothetical protein